ncbi:cyclophilin, partial [Vibrio parahaemolyticus]|uniref:peptidylprolyl isomerase n=1 Tax=Vibrio parahaemolyticus TaxID=670 RepID=UPI00062B1DD6
MFIMITYFSDIEITLNLELVPVSSKNFKTYCEEGLYNGTIFHRVIDGFMNPGGGHNEDMTEKPTRAPIANEANRGLKNTVSTIAEARTD